MLPVQNWEWPLVWEGLAAAVGVTLEAVERPETIQAARKAASIGGKMAPLVLDGSPALSLLPQPPGQPAAAAAVAE